MVTDSKLDIVILAAGKGTRMKSSRAKVLHELFFAPMLHHVLDAVAPLNAAKTVAVVGHQSQNVADSIESYNVDTTLQEEQLGTGHAVLCAKNSISAGSSTVMILCGDTPLIRSASLQEMYRFHRKQNSVITLMTTLLDDPFGYGRIICDNDNITAIVEEKDADPAQKDIKEINAGIYCVESDFLFSALQKVGTDNSQGEVYLTDIVGLAVKSGHTVHRVINPNGIDVLGVNSRLELSQAHQELKSRRNLELMSQGVTLLDPLTTTIAPEVKIGADSIIQGGVEISGSSSVGAGCRLMSGAILHNASLGDSVQVGPYCCLTGCHVEAGTELKPHTILDS
ncbi:MAG: NTP transferase domain-containing protein [Thermodesulfobacteriota bacterium]